MKKIITLVFMGVFLLAFASALQETPISYIQKINYQPNCGTTCQNISTIISNVSVEYVNCTTTCAPVLDIGLMFAGDDDFESINIDTSQELYKNGSDFIIPGTYMATLGNTSDVTGLNEKILNLSATVNKNLAECYSMNIGLEQNHSKKISECEQERTSCDVSLSQRITQINEMEKFKGQRLWFALLGVAGGILLIKFGVPYLQEHRPKRDPNEYGQSPYTGQP